MKALRTELSGDRPDMDFQHLFFDSTGELSRQGYFQWIDSLRAEGTPEISVQPCLSFSRGNPQNDNSISEDIRGWKFNNQ